MTNIKVIKSHPDIIDTVSEIDLDAYIHTTYKVNDYVLRRYPPSKLGGIRTSMGHGGVGLTMS